MNDKKEFIFEDLLSKVFRFIYWIYLALGILGVIFYMLHMDQLLMIETIIVVVLYVLQYGINFLNSLFGTIWILIGGILGYLYFHSWIGICLGINVLLVIRHLVKDVFYRLIFKGANILNKL